MAVFCQDSGVIVVSNFTKDTVANLISWYKADEGVTPTNDGGTLTSWEDMSDSANDIVNISGTPIYHTNVQNSLPAILFESGCYAYSGDGTDKAQPNTVFCVFKGTSWVAASGYQTVVDTISSQQLGKNNGDTSTYISSGTVLAGDAIANNTCVLLIGIFKGATSSIQINNNIPVTGNAGTGDNKNRILMGTDNSATQDYTGYIMEHLVYNAELSASDIEIVKTYLIDKWGL